MTEEKIKVFVVLRQITAEDGGLCEQDAILFSTREGAVARAKELLKEDREDSSWWTNDEYTWEVNEETGEFSIYEDGWYNDNHYDVRIVERTVD